MISLWIWQNITNIPHLTQTHYNSNIANLLTITGSGYENIEYINIGGASIRTIFSSGNVFIPIEKNLFSSGEYFLFFGLKNGQVIASNQKITFIHSEALINIANISPNILQNSEERYIVIQWNGFNKIISIQLSNNLILRNAEFKIINDQVAGVRIPKDLLPGTYYFNIMDTNSIYELKDMIFTIINTL